MTEDTTAKPVLKGRPANFKPVDLHPDTAFAMWIENDCPSDANLETLLRAKGYTISKSTLRRWANRYGWDTLRLSPQGTASSARVMHTCETLKREAERAGPELYAGLQTRIIVTLADAVPRVQLSTPDDVSRMIDAAERLRSLIHNLRGDKFTGEATMAPMRDTDNIGQRKGTLSDTLKRAGIPDGQPVVEIGAFRKTNGTNGSNGANGGTHG